MPDQAKLSVYTFDEEDHGGPGETKTCAEWAQGGSPSVLALGPRRRRRRPGHQRDRVRGRRPPSLAKKAVAKKPVRRRSGGKR